MSKQMAISLFLVMAGCGTKPDFEPFDVYAAGEAAIYGYVTDLYSCPLAEAQVLVLNSELGETTNAQGQYRIRLNASASYDVAVERSGFDLATVSLDIGVRPLRHDFPLVPKCEDGRCPAYTPPCQSGIGQVGVPPH
jgi:hypothetical protein